VLVAEIEAEGGQVLVVARRQRRIVRYGGGFTSALAAALSGQFRVYVVAPLDSRYSCRSTTHSRPAG
jgi:hypothetical protein